MGWAKYCEDNMSIYIGRMALRDSVPAYSCRIENYRIVEVSSSKCENKQEPSDTIMEAEDSRGRRGLELTFQNGVDERMIRKLQLNGWWWSRTRACWCNYNSKGNRKYARNLAGIGAKMSTAS